jgi:hypothetical protein
MPYIEVDIGSVLASKTSPSLVVIDPPLAIRPGKILSEFLSCPLGLYMRAHKMIGSLGSMMIRRKRKKRRRGGRGRGRGDREEALVEVKVVMTRTDIDHQGKRALLRGYASEYLSSDLENLPRRIGALHDTDMLVAERLRTVLYD